MAADPKSLAYFYRGQPARRVGGKAATTGADLFLRGQPYRGIVPASSSSATAAPTGIATGESAGTPSLSAGAVSAAPGGIVSGEVVGTPSLAPGPIDAAPGGIASGESAGTPSASPGASSVAPGGVGTGEVVGTPTLAPAGAGKPAVGTPLQSSHPLHASLVAAWGILETSGTTLADSVAGDAATLPAQGSIVPNSGSPYVSLTSIHAGAALASMLTLPAATSWWAAWGGTRTASNGVADAVFGRSDQTTIVEERPGGLFVRAPGIADTVLSFSPDWEAEHDYFLAATFTGPSTFAFAFHRDGVQVATASASWSSGAPAFDLIGNALNIPDYSYVGRLDYVYFGSGRDATVSDASALHSDPYGIFAASGPGTVAPGGIASAEAAGTPTLAPGPITIAPGGIGTAEAAGIPSLSGPDTATPPGIATGESAGTPVLSPVPIDASPGGVPTAESLGIPSASGVTSGGAGSVAPGGIASAEHVGSPTLSVPVQASGLVGNWPRSIFPASVFPRSIFPGPAAPAPPEPEPAAVAGPDWMVLDDVVARLLATRAFEEAAWGANLELLFPESSYPAAAVEYVGTTEAPISDIAFAVKDGRYTLTIAARGEDMRGRSAALQALAATARNALSGVSLAGICQPYFCRLRVDGPAAASPPEARLRLVGSYRYTIEDDDSRDDSLD